MVAGTEPNPENKLFVGGCPPGSSEEELRQIFEQHGTVEEVFIMRGGSRSGMACAFIRFETQAMAQAAIDAVHGQITLPKTAEPLVVRWADAPGNRRRESRDRRKQANGANGRENNVQQVYPAYMGMQIHPGLVQMQMQMHQQHGMPMNGGYFPQGGPQMAQHMQSWQHQQMQQMGLMLGYPPHMPPQQAAMMVGGPQQQMVMSPGQGDPRMMQGFGREGFGKEGLEVMNQGIATGPSQHWPYS